MTLGPRLSLYLHSKGTEYGENRGYAEYGSVEVWAYGHLGTSMDITGEAVTPEEQKTQHTPDTNNEEKNRSRHNAHNASTETDLLGFLTTASTAYLSIRVSRRRAAELTLLALIGPANDDDETATSGARSTTPTTPTR